MTWLYNCDAIKHNEWKATCHWFQIIFILRTYVNRIWTIHLWTVTFNRVYITCFLDLQYVTCTCDKWLVFTLTFTYYFNETKHLKLVTCCYQLPTHSAWSQLSLSSEDSDYVLSTTTGWIKLLSNQNSSLK